MSQSHTMLGRTMFITLLLVMLVSFSGQSQSLEFGAYAGITSTRLQGDSPKRFRYSSSIAPVVGGIVNFYIKDDVRISFQPGYAVFKPVMQYEDRDAEELIDSLTLELDYVRLPVLLDIVSDNQKWHFMAGLDPQVSIMRNAVVGGEDVDISDDIRLVNLNVVFGLGRIFHIKSTRLGVDLQFLQGLFNVSDQLNDDSSYTPRIKTSTIQLSAYILFGGKRENP